VSPAFHTHYEQVQAEVCCDPAPATIVVADGLALVREGLAKICSEIPGCCVVAQCADGIEAYQAISDWRPAIALLDFELGEVHTLDLIRRLRESGACTKFVVVSMRRDRKSAFESIRAGAAGFVLKSGPLEELSKAIDQIRNGGVYVTPSVNLENRNKDESDQADAFETLSAREHQVFTMLVDGVRAKEIAARLDLSPKTVERAVTCRRNPASRSGKLASSLVRSPLAIAIASVAWLARTVALRGAFNTRLISPKDWPGPSTAIH
jgi:DNA-binding NarL/FixJ family response regulator